jgi:hypothetical protein
MVTSSNSNGATGAAGAPPGTAWAALGNTIPAAPLKIPVRKKRRRFSPEKFEDFVISINLQQRFEPRGPPVDGRASVLHQYIKVEVNSLNGQHLIFRPHLDRENGRGRLLSWFV